MGYHNCHVPTTILRNILENPGWYVLSWNSLKVDILDGIKVLCTSASFN